jgi:peroxiredoxin
MQPLLKPGMPAPPLAFETLNGNRWDLQETRPTGLDLIAVYRGVFCPYCKHFTSELAKRFSAFNERGFTPITVSMDDKSRAEAAATLWKLGGMEVGFGLTAEAIRPWGIFLTRREQEGEIRTFCEPALLMVRPDKTIFAMHIQSLPSGRPDLDDLLHGLVFLAQNGYPIRGSA